MGGGDSILAIERVSLGTWHKLLAHLHFDALNTLVRNYHMPLFNPPKGRQFHKLLHSPRSIVYYAPLTWYSPTCGCHRRSTFMMDTCIT